MGIIHQRTPDSRQDRTRWNWIKTDNALLDRSYLGVVSSLDNRYHPVKTTISEEKLKIVHIYWTKLISGLVTRVCIYGFGPMASKQMDAIGALFFFSITGTVCCDIVWLFSCWRDGAEQFFLGPEQKSQNKICNTFLGADMEPPLTDRQSHASTKHSGVYLFL